MNLNVEEVLQQLRLAEKEALALRRYFLAARRETIEQAAERADAWWRNKEAGTPGAAIRSLKGTR